ncbi:hypothetical protein CPLU01_04298 [Colletotrichum plurivorum]|uniref:Uncharacterized protein n=1 Tax=Colletotrichum plurivorum TaxID=2175906 RepID=A0A8H6NJ12_9PEZI|nr:hypothetical protein CPLU01_04298 [Colletotrichum plurivorum]
MKQPSLTRRGGTNGGVTPFVPSAIVTRSSLEIATHARPQKNPPSAHQGKSIFLTRIRKHYSPSPQFHTAPRASRPRGNDHRRTRKTPPRPAPAAEISSMDVGDDDGQTADARTNMNLRPVNIPGQA